MSIMATNSFKNPILPVSDPPIDKEEEKERILKRGDDRIFKGSAMTKRGAYAAICYMSCAGSFYFPSSLFHFIIFSSLIAFFNG